MMRHLKCLMIYNSEEFITLEFIKAKLLIENDCGCEHTKKRYTHTHTIYEIHFQDQFGKLTMKNTDLVPKTCSSRSAALRTQGKTEVTWVKRGDGS